MIIIVDFLTNFNEVSQPFKIFSFFILGIKGIKIGSQYGNVRTNSVITNFISGQEMEKY